ncbi:MAG TPA: ATP-binding protein [Pyrinomonadaceae bacterium]|nr:ATP-binding protein [Pyrinomonadaceae bacterium]
MNTTKEWCATALAGVASMWNAKEHHAWRTSKSVAENQKSHRSRTSAEPAYYPTATFHAITAFGQCGAWDKGTEYDASAQILRTPYMDVRNIPYFSAYEEVLRTLVGQGRSWKKGNWVNVRIQSSSHTKRQGTKKKVVSSLLANPRQAFVIGRLFQAIRLLITPAVREKESLVDEIHKLHTSSRSPAEIRKAKTKIKELTRLLDQVRAGLPIALHYLLNTIERKDLKKEITLADLSESPSMSPYLLLQVAIGISEYETILKKLNLSPASARPNLRRKRANALENLKEVLDRYFSREVDRLMSRRQVVSDPHYDASSLAFAIHGLTLVNESIREKPLFRACIEAIVAGQNDNGCWSDSRSATFDDTGTAIQQPSVDVALSLAECVFSPSLLLGNDAWRMELLRIGVPALNKTANYLTQSFANNLRTSSGRICAGWVSDRVRWPQVSETWITAMAARLFYYLWVAERACNRVETLSIYGAKWPELPKDKSHPVKRIATATPRFVPETWIENVITKNAEASRWLHEPLRSGDDIDKWYQKIIEPDSEALPIGTLVKKVLRAIEQQRLQERSFHYPDKNGISFIIYGPPGSGKTFFVSKIAEFLGWPLLTLNPGHFIKGGLESIESTSAEIFNALMRLDHTVVFFDECDELFRERSERKGDASGRNILSFATACMLPKLQEFHDAGRVIFFLGTNFVSHVDTAIRRPGRFDDLLLFDRPDEKARKLHVNREWKKEWKNKWKENIKLKGGAEPTAEVRRAIASQSLKDLAKIFPRVKEAPNYTAGWIIKDIHRYASTLALNTPFSDQISIDDYVSWCAVHGEDELRATRLSDDAILRIQRRWHAVDPKLYEQKFEEAHKEKTEPHIKRLKARSRVSVSSRSRKL